jgi:hypothetical protein
MGAPVETGIENFEEVILSLSASDPAKLIGWISESLVEEIESEPPAQKIEPGTESTPEDNVEWPPANVKFADNPSGQASWHEGIPQAKYLTEEERKEIGHELFGAWKDSTPDDLAEQILSSRTLPTREINLND